MGVKDTANYCVIPSGYAGNKLYQQIPLSQNATLTYGGGLNRTRINGSGLLENIGNQYYPAISYDCVDGIPTGCPKFLNEPARTNYVLESEFSDLTAWGKTNTTLSGPITSSPNINGAYGIIRLSSDTTNSLHTIFQTISGLTAGRTYGVSVFVQTAGCEGIELVLNGSGTPDPACKFDLKLKYPESASTSTILNSAFVHEYPNGWLRIGCLLQAVGTPNILEIRMLKSDGTSLANQYIGDSSTDQVIIYAPQIESPSAASAPDCTSFIPTTTSATTRPDSYLRSAFYSIADNKLPSSYPISVYWEGSIDRYAANQRAWSIAKANSSENISLIFSSTTTIQIQRQNSSSSYLTSIDYRTFKHDYLKILVVFVSETTFDIYINGALISSETGSSVPFTFTQYHLGSGLSNTADAGQRQSFHQWLFWNKILTTKEAKDVTRTDSYSNLARDYNFSIK